MSKAISLRSWRLLTCASLCLSASCVESRLRVLVFDQPDAESCNGIDDDGDGTIDEDFPDLDQDGIADCIDESCDVVSPPGAIFGADADCYETIDVPSDPWTTRVEWGWDPPGDSSVEVAPVVGLFADTNDDGRVDERDTPQVVFVSGTRGKGVLRVVDGRTSEERWSIPEMSAYSGLALADVDVDGVPEVIAYDHTRHVVAIDHNAQIKWRSSQVVRPKSHIAVADLDGDGLVEIVVDRSVFEGATGRLLFEMEVSPTIEHWQPVVADLDRDGSQEIIAADSVFSADGRLLWGSERLPGRTMWAMVLNADADADAEVVFVGGGWMEVYDTDGTLLHQTATTTEGAGPPCAADFDGDGMPEIAWTATSNRRIVELDGTELWHTSVRDYSGYSGCAAFDFDGDSIYEMVAGDEQNLLVHDGRTGVRQFIRREHTSGTMHEYPVIVDVDGDGAAEILLPSSDRREAGWSGLRALGHAGSGWPRSGPSWATHAYQTSSVMDNGTVPSAPEPFWLEFNSFRARPSADGLGVDLRVEVVDSCHASCQPSGRVKLSVQLSNYGTRASIGGISVAVYRVDNGVSSWVKTVLHEAAVPSGSTTEALIIELTKSQIGNGGLSLSVDDLGDGEHLQLECNEANNTTSWVSDVCP